MYHLQPTLTMPMNKNFKTLVETFSTQIKPVAILGLKKK
jgi:hypothetical protein